MNERVLREQKSIIKDLLVNEMFKKAIKEVKDDISAELFITSDRDKRDVLYYEMKVIDLVMGRLQSYANDIIMEKK